jgi:hypothetical protein
VGQQEIHEHEAPGGAGKQRLRCGITGFIYWTDLLTNLRITIDSTSNSCFLSIHSNCL